jgi:hypothetical protein
MTDKIRRPKVKLPGPYKISIMMSGVANKGKVDRSYIKLMCSAIHTYETRRNESMRKLNSELFSNE